MPFLMKKKLLILISALLGLILLILVILPGIARYYLVRHSKEYIGRQFDIDQIRLNYFTTTIRIKGFKLYEADEKDVFVSFDKLLLNIQPFNLLKNELVVEEFYINGLYANIIRRDSTFNFDDIIVFLNKPADSAVSDTTTSKPLLFRLYNLSLKKANFIFDDRNVGKATQITDFSINIPFIEWNQENTSEAGLKFTFGREGTFESFLDFHPATGDISARVIIDRLHLDTFKEYIDYYSDIQSLDGIFNCDINLAGNVFNAEEILYSGKVNLQDVALNDLAGEKIIGADRIGIGIKKIDLAGSRFELDSLVLTKPYVHFVLKDSTNNLTEAFYSSPEPKDGTETETDTTSVPASAGTLHYSVGTFMIKNGVVDYTDFMTDEPFIYHLTEIELNADSITSEADWMHLYSSMKLNNRGTLKAEAGFAPLDPMGNLTLNYVITDFILSDLNIYSKFYMGFPILTGKMYYKSGTTIREGKLQSENMLTMTEVELGEKGRGLYDIPVKLALFILKDRNGVINLDVPVRGDLKDPKIRLGKLIWNTFKNLMVKIALAPFDALAGQLGADPKDLEFIGFEYMDTVLTVQKQHQLDLLLTLEKQKAGLGIDLICFNDQVREKEMILNSGISVTGEAELQKLANIYSLTRKGTIEEYLHEKNDSTTIRVSFSNLNDPLNKGSKPVFKIVYSLMENH